jgi:uncharacterized membrane protein
MNTPLDHVSSQPQPEIAKRGHSRNGQVFAIIGLVLQTHIVVGIAQFAVLMLKTLREITESGNPDPQIMATGIGEALIPLVLWGAFGLIGLLMTLVTAIVSTYRARWFFRSSLVFAGVYFLFFPPIGSLIAIVLVVYLVTKREEFSEQEQRRSSVVPAA